MIDRFVPDEVRNYAANNRCGNADQDTFMSRDCAVGTTENSCQPADNCAKYNPENKIHTQPFVFPARAGLFVNALKDGPRTPRAA